MMRYVLDESRCYDRASFLGVFLYDVILYGCLGYRCIISCI